MPLANNQSTLRSIQMDSPSTDKAREVIYNLPDLRKLSVVIEMDTSLPSPVLPNLADLAIDFDHDGAWLQLFHGAVLGKVEAITFKSGFERVGGFLEAFEDAALAASIQDTRWEFHSYTQCSRDPNYSSLLPFA